MVSHEISHLLTLLYPINFACFCPQIKAGNDFEKEEPNFGTYVEMVDIETRPTTYGRQAEIFERYFTSCFEGRYVSLQKFYGENDINEIKPFEFREVMVWVE